LTSSLESPDKRHDFASVRAHAAAPLPVVAPAGAGADDAYGGGLPDEGERTRLIGELARLLREPLIPDSTRTAGLTLIGWLARRMPGEEAHALGVREARKSERRQKVR
jgi:hypothetical protein